MLLILDKEKARCFVGMEKGEERDVWLKIEIDRVREEREGKRRRRGERRREMEEMDSGGSEGSESD